MKKVKSKYANLFYRLRPCKLDPTKDEKVWSGRYKDAETGAWTEAVIGWEISDGIDEDAAYQILIDFRKGKRKKVTTLKVEAKAMEEESRRSSLLGLWEDYVAGFDRNGLSRKDKPIYKTDKGTFTNYLLPFFKKIAPENITEKDLELLKGSLRKKGLALQTIKHVLGLLRRILKAAKVNKDLEFVMPRVDRGRKKDGITDEQLGRLMEVLKTHPNRGVCQMMTAILYTGMRQGEVRKLKWKDLDLDEGWLFLRDPSQQ